MLGGWPTAQGGASLQGEAHAEAGLAAGVVHLAGEDHRQVWLQAMLQDRCNATGRVDLSAVDVAARAPRAACPR